MASKEVEAAYLRLDHAVRVCEALHLSGAVTVADRERLANWKHEAEQARAAYDKAVAQEAVREAMDILGASFTEKGTLVQAMFQGVDVRRLRELAGRGSGDG